MGLFNYRVFYREVSGQEECFIAEAYYEGGRVHSRTNAVGPSGSDLSELAQDLVYFLRALTMPVLDAETFEEIPNADAGGDWLEQMVDASMRAAVAKFPAEAFISTFLIRSEDT